MKYGVFHQWLQQHAGNHKLLRTRFNVQLQIKCFLVAKLQNDQVLPDDVQFLFHRYHTPAFAHVSLEQVV
ncbi:hypothetical protein D3C71_2106560 [compost metagenome]